MLVGLLVFLIVVAAIAVFAFFYAQVQKNRRPEVARPSLEKSESLGNCARCGQQRLLVSKDAGLCASCWSALRTKQN
jgi:hypothetical protein